MKTYKTKYYTTVALESENIVLKKAGMKGVVETWMVAVNKNNKRIRMPKFDGFYFNSELKSIN